MEDRHARQTKPSNIVMVATAISGNFQILYFAGVHGSAARGLTRGKVQSIFPTLPIAQSETWVLLSTFTASAKEA